MSAKRREKSMNFFENSFFTLGRKRCLSHEKHEKPAATRPEAPSVNLMQGVVKWLCIW
jgi:hypothetical protein